MLNLALIPLVPKAVSVLHAGKKDNLIYNAAGCFGELRHGDVGPIMPLDRMPFIAVKAPWPKYLGGGVLLLALAGKAKEKV